MRKIGVRAAGIGAAITLVGVAGVPATADASFPGKNGKLAVSTIEPGDDSGTCGPQELPCASGQLRIGLFDVRARATSVLPTCTLGSCSDTSPSWSPDGRQLAYTRADVNVVMLAEADGSNPRSLTTGRVASWSVDGRRLVIEDRPNNRARPQLYVIRADGSGRRQLTRAGGAEPAWSSSNRIVFSRYNARIKRNQLRIIRPGGGPAKRVVAGGEKADWSPKATKLVFRSTVKGRPGLWVARADGSRQRRLTGSGSSASWSPDGSRIAFERGGRLYDVSAARAGAKPRQLGGRQLYTPAWQPLR